MYYRVIRRYRTIVRRTVVTRRTVRRRVIYPKKRRKRPALEVLLIAVFGLLGGYLALLYDGGTLFTALGISIMAITYLYVLFTAD